MQLYGIEWFIQYRAGYITGHNKKKFFLLWDGTLHEFITKPLSWYQGTTTTLDLIVVFITNKNA